MKFSWKKGTMCLLVYLLLVSSVLGCSSGGNTEKSSSQIKDTAAAQEDNIVLDGSLPIIKNPDEFPKMRALIVNPPQRTKPVDEMLQVQRLQEATGVYFQWQEIPSEGAGEKINLMLAGNDLPDVFWNGISNEMVTQYMDKNIFIPTEALTEKHMQRLSGIYEQRPQYKAQTTAPDGHHYGFPYIEEMYGLVLTPGPFYINKAWLDQLGLSMPQTVDEFVNCLRAFRDADDLNGNGEKDEIPYSLYFGAKDGFGSYNTFNQFTACFGEATTYGGRPEDYLGIRNGKVVFTATNDAYRKTAEFFRGLYEENLIDIDSFSPGTNDQPLFLNKLKGDVAQVGAFGIWSETGEIPNPEVRAQYEALPRLQGESGKMGHKLNFSEVHTNCAGTITTACEYPEVVAAFADYCYDPEISVTTNWGAIDYVYKKGEDGILHFDLDKNDQIILKDGYKTFDDLRNNSTVGGGTPLAVLNEYYGTIADYTWDAQPIIDGQKTNGKEDILKEYVSVPRMMLPVDKQNQVAQIQPQIFNLVTQYTTQWVLDGQISETWENYKNDLQAAGVEDLIAIYQEAYDQYLENMA